MLPFPIKSGFDLKWSLERFNGLLDYFRHRMGIPVFSKLGASGYLQQFWKQSFDTITAQHAGSAKEPSTPNVKINIYQSNENYILPISFWYSPDQDESMVFSFRAGWNHLNSSVSFSQVQIPGRRSMGLSSNNHKLQPVLSCNLAAQRMSCRRLYLPFSLSSCFRDTFISTRLSNVRLRNKTNSWKLLLLLFVIILPVPWTTILDNLICHFFLSCMQIYFRPPVLCSQ